MGEIDFCIYTNSKAALGKYVHNAALNCACRVKELCMWRERSTAQFIFFRLNVLPHNLYSSDFMRRFFSFGAPTSNQSSADIAVAASMSERLQQSRTVAAAFDALLGADAPVAVDAPVVAYRPEMCFSATLLGTRTRMFDGQVAWSRLDPLVIDMAAVPEGIAVTTLSPASMTLYALPDCGVLRTFAPPVQPAPVWLAKPNNLDGAVEIPELDGAVERLELDGAVQIPELDAGEPYVPPSDYPSMCASGSGTLIVASLACLNEVSLEGTLVRQLARAELRDRPGKVTAMACNGEYVACVLPDRVFLLDYASGEVVSRFVPAGKECLADVLFVPGTSDIVTVTVSAASTETRISVFTMDGTLLRRFVPNNLDAGVFIGAGFTVAGDLLLVHRLKSRFLMNDEVSVHVMTDGALLRKGILSNGRGHWHQSAHVGAKRLAVVHDTLFVISFDSVLYAYCL